MQSSGAVECQKPKSTLHMHFRGYAQRLHQFKSLEEIGKLLEEAATASTYRSNTERTKHDEQGRTTIATKPPQQHYFSLNSELFRCNAAAAHRQARMQRVMADGSNYLCHGKRIEHCATTRRQNCSHRTRRLSKQGIAAAAHVDQLLPDTPRQTWQ